MDMDMDIDMDRDMDMDMDMEVVMDLNPEHGHIDITKVPSVEAVFVGPRWASSWARKSANTVISNPHDIILYSEIDQSLPNRLTYYLARLHW
jgi:hypothetical protein